MNAIQKEQILSVLEHAQDMTIATVRLDGYPQATTVSYVNDDLVIYFGCDTDSQKARNLARNNKVSLTINLGYSNWNEIRGLSLGGIAERVVNTIEIAKVGALMLRKFPQIANYATEGNGMESLALFRVTPQVVSVLDYRKGFGHTELIDVAAPPATPSSAKE